MRLFGDGLLRPRNSVNDEQRRELRVERSHDLQQSRVFLAKVESEAAVRQARLQLLHPPRPIVRSRHGSYPLTLQQLARQGMRFVGVERVLLGVDGFLCAKSCSRDSSTASFASSHQRRAQPLVSHALGSKMRQQRPFLLLHLATHARSLLSAVCLPLGLTFVITLARVLCM